MNAERVASRVTGSVILLLMALGGATLPTVSGQSAAPSTADLATLEKQAQTVYERIAPAIVRITYRQFPMGTGLIVSSDGHVLTSSGAVHSVVEDAMLSLHLPDGRQVAGQALGWSSQWAIGVLKIDAPGPWPCVELPKAADAETGQYCIALGYPDFGDAAFDQRPTLQLGRVTRSAAPFWFTSSCSMKAGGYSLFDVEGRLLGVTCKVPVNGDPVHSGVAMVTRNWDDLTAGKNLERNLNDVKPLEFESDELQTSQDPDGESKKASDDPVDPAVIAQAKAASVRIDELSVSGVIVTSDGYIITCAHHAGLAGQQVTVQLADGRDAPALIRGTNPVTDLAVLKFIDEGPWPHAMLGNSVTMQPGDRCVAIGYPTGQPGRTATVRETHIVLPTKTLPRRDSASANFWTSGYPRSMGGVSGGGVFDRSGRVIGVLLGGAMGLTEEDGEMMHARVETFRQQWDSLADQTPVESFATDPLAEISTRFEPIANDQQSIVVTIMTNGKPCALGTIVGSNGRILTKASELQEDISCRLVDGRVFPASVEELSPEHDLALVKIDVEGLKTARWSDNDVAKPGSLTAALIPGKSPRVGVVSLAARPTPPVHSDLGVELRDSEHGLEVANDSRSGGIEVPLREGDVVLHVQGHPTPDLAAYYKLHEMVNVIPAAGRTLQLVVRRDGKTLELKFPAPPSRYVLQFYPARTSSARWWDFASVFGVDMALTRRHCGAPIIDLNGQVVGIVIAYRAGPGGSFAQCHVLPGSACATLFPAIPDR